MCGNTIKQNAYKHKNNTIIMVEALVICAHPDDEIFGSGATIAKYAKEGKDTITVICSAGEFSHMWLRDEYKNDMRQQESISASKIVKTKKVVFLGLKDGSLGTEMDNKLVEDKITNIIKKERPKKIFTHSIDDPHPDHRAVYNSVLRLSKKLKYKGAIYSFEVWNIGNFKKRDVPKLYVDVSDTFSLKIKALKQFRSQIGSLIPLLPAVYLRSFISGMHSHCRFAEVFYKVQ
jgi:N-acetylglucosamine malate deacetylase 1